MKASSRLLPVLALVSALGATGMPAEAALRAVGPINPVTTLPAWFQDNQSLALGLCLDQQPLPSGNTPCVLTPPFDPLVTNPVVPITTVGPISDANFPDESFWWIADTLIQPVGQTGAGRVTFRYALEAAFLGAGPVVAPNTGVSFLRLNVGPISDLVPNATYTVTHPFGTFQMTADAGGVAPRFRVEDPIAPTPADPGALLPATNTNIGPFLIWDPAAPPAAPAGYIGDPGVAHPLINPATGAQSVLTITGPNIGGIGVNTVTTNLWNLAGKKIGMGVTPFPNASVATVVGTPKLIGNALTGNFTITNLTGAALDLTAAGSRTITGLNAADFTIINDTCAAAPLPATVPPAASSTCTFDVQFNPAASTIAARTATLTITPADIATAPPMTVNLNGTAQYAIALTTVGNGTVTNEDGSAAVANEVINAGATKVYRVVPTAGFLPLVRVNTVRQAVTGGTVTLPTIGANQTTAVSFLRAGDVDQSGGNPAIADAMRALRIAVGVSPAPTDEEITTADVGPLVSGAPRQSGKIDISDVMVILRRAVGLQPLW